MVTKTRLRPYAVRAGLMLAGLAAAQAFAADAVSSPPPSSTPAAGTVILSAGPAYLQDATGERTQLSRGAVLVPGQTIVTGEGGFVHVRMSDGGLVAVRPLSEFELEVFDYHQDAGSDRVRYRLEQGVARSITGAVGDANKEAFRLNTPVAAVGVRGTDFVVATNAATSRVAINSGAVVVAALGDSCQASGFGACTTDSLLLGAGDDSRGKYVEVVSGEQIPRMVHDPSSGPDAMTPPHEQEPATVSALSERNADLPAESERASPPPPAVTPEPTQPDRLPLAGLVAAPADTYWGRWSNAAQVDGLSLQRVADLRVEGKRVLIANSVYGAGLDAMPSSLPRTGQADFLVAGGEGVLKTATGALPLDVAAGQLSVNFDSRSFDMQSQFDGNGTQYLTQAAGAVDSRGYLLSDVSRSNSVVNGALGADLNSAITTVERSYADGDLSGVITWGRQ